MENIPLRLALIQCDYNTNEASALDATPVAPNENRVANQQAGPLRASRAMAMVYIAMFEALNSVIGSYTSYTNLSRAINGTSAEAAVFQATHDTLVHLYPSQQPIFDSQLSTQLAQIPTGPGKILGVQKGSESAQLIIAMRTNDGSQIPEPIIIQGINPSPTVDTINNIYYAGTAPGMWRNDPITPKPIALGARWSEVTPLSIPSANSFRCGPPPDLTSVEYAMAFNEVKSVGGNGTTTATVRSQEATNQLFEKHPDISKPTRSHQDNGYFKVTPAIALTFWISLDRIDEDNGALITPLRLISLRLGGIRDIINKQHLESGPASLVYLYVYTNIRKKRIKL